MHRRAARFAPFLALLAAAAVLAAAPARSAPEDKVYVTKSGKTFHVKDCRTIKNSKDPKEMTRKDAEEKKLTACKVCKP